MTSKGERFRDSPDAPVIARAEWLIQRGRGLEAVAEVQRAFDGGARPPVKEHPRWRKVAVEILVLARAQFILSQSLREGLLSRAETVEAILRVALETRNWRLARRWIPPDSSSLSTHVQGLLWAAQTAHEKTGAPWEHRVALDEGSSFASAPYRLRAACWSRDWIAAREPADEAYAGGSGEALEPFTLKWVVCAWTGYRADDLREWCAMAIEDDPDPWALGYPIVRYALAEYCVKAGWPALAVDIGRKAFAEMPMGGTMYRNLRLVLFGARRPWIYVPTLAQAWATTFRLLVLRDVLEATRPSAKAHE